MVPVFPTAVTDAIGWAVIAAFVIAWGLRRSASPAARPVAAAGWAGFAGFWLLLVPRFALVMRSPIETVLTALAVPACLYAGYLLWSGRESLLTLTWAVAIMGLVYLPFETFEPLRRIAIETVAMQVYLVIRWLGYDVVLEAGPEAGYQSALVFTNGGHELVTYIVLACTGIGSITIFAGLIAALDAPWGRKARAIGLAAGIIYVLNIARNVFIAVAYGQQWFQVWTGPILSVTGYGDPALVSFFIADRVLSQSLSVVALVLITWIAVRTVPELLVLLEEALFLLTRTEYDLQAAFAAEAGDR